MVAGCLAWQRHGLQVPAVIRAASDAYFDSQNTLGEWIAEALCEMPNAWTRTMDLFDAWKQWCEPRSLPHGSAKSFAEAMEERGFVKKLDPQSRRAGFLGIALRLGGRV
jgi:putative DNA primase/helicase